MSFEVSERTVGIQMSDEDAEKLSALAANAENRKGVNSP